jgi:hypothetical protein
MILFNSQKVKEPHGFNIEKYKLTKSGRLASGRMVIDIIAKKRKFVFSYKSISGPQLDLIAQFVDGDMSFFELTYEENNVIKTATVYSGALKATQFRKGSICYWTNVSFDLIEQ